MMAFAAMAMGNQNHHWSAPNETNPLRDRKAEQEKINLARGLKKFNIDGKEVWALNEERARKKAKR